MMWAALLAGWSLACASCVERPPALTTPGEPRDERLNGVALLDMDENDGPIGPPTPEPQGIPPALQDLRSMLNTLWDDGEEQTIYLMEGFLRLELRADVQGPGTVEWMAWQEVRRFGQTETHPYLTPWWRLWLRGVLDRWRQTVEPRGDETGLMQKAMLPGRRRLEEWDVFMHQLRELSPEGRRLVAFLLERWLKRRVGFLAVPLVTLGGMLRDILPHQCGIPGCSAETSEFARNLAEGMIASLEQAFQDDELNIFGVAEVSGAVVHAAVDLATRADRRQVQDQLPIDDAWDDGLEQECGEVGHLLSKWLRKKLPTSAPRRGLVYRRVVERLRVQLAEECRHLRRLHMGFQQVQQLTLDQDQLLTTDAETQDDEEARDLVDQIIMLIGNVRSKPTVMDMLGRVGGTGSSCSTGPAGTMELGTLFQEAESLRRWLNEHFEGSLETMSDTLADETMLGELSSEDMPECVMEGEQESAEVTKPDEPDNDELNLGQKGRGKSRSRPRSRSRGRRTWSAATARGWSSPGGTWFDGNAHRPWRRGLIAEAAEDDVRTASGRPRCAEGNRGERGHEAMSRSGRGSTDGDRPAASTAPTSNSARPRPARPRAELPEPMEEHAWHVLMDMADMDSNPANLQYGLTAAGIDNVQASFVGMTQHERSCMFIALLRVLSRILMDIANAATSAMVELREEDLEVDVDADQNLGVKTTTKAERLARASEKVVLREVLGSEKDKLSRSLMASLERMQVEEARRCSQNLLRRLLRWYGAEADDGIEGLPPDAQEFLAGMVAYGADISEGTVAGTSMDEYFVDHWWGLVMSTLTSPMASGTVTGATSAEQGQASAEPENTPTQLSAQTFLGLRGDDMNAQVAGVIELEDSGADVPHLDERHEDLQGEVLEPEAKDMVVDADREAGCGAGSAMSDEMGAPAPIATVSEPVTSTFASGENRRALLQACEELTAAKYRDWEMWGMQQAMGNTECAGVNEVVIRGAVRHRHGGLGTTQSMVFFIRDNERLDLQIQGVSGREGRKRSVAEVGVQSDLDGGS